MEMTKLGSAGPAVSRAGLGCMGLSGTYGPAEEPESIATIHAALDAGINLLDTGDFYGMGHNELLIAEALGADTIRRAAAVHPICDLQIEYSLVSRGVEEAILPTCRELGIAITAYGVLSRGLIGGGYASDRSGPGDIRSHFPRFQGANLRRNRELVDRLRSLAQAKGSSVAQVAIAWVLGRGQDIVPLIGSRQREQLHNALGALALELDDRDLEQIDEAVSADAVAGERYPPPQMGSLDSER